MPSAPGHTPPVEPPCVPVDAQRAADYAHALLDAVETRGGDLAHARRFHLPGLTLEARFCTPALAQLASRALVDDAAYAAGARTVRVYVGTPATLPGCPRGRWAAPLYDIGALTAGLHARGLYGLYDIDHDIWQFFDPQRGLGVQLMTDATRYPPWEDGFPLRHFLHWAHQGTQRRLIHAGTIGIDGRGAFVLGAGGAGKSGTTLACILAGMSSAGDDYVLAELGTDTVHTHPVTRLMKQDLAGLRRLGLDARDARFSGPNWQGKYVFDSEQLGRGRRAQQLRMTAILLPRIAGLPHTRIERASAREAMMALAPSSLYQLLGGWHEGFAVMARIVRQLPVYRVALGTEPVEIAESIANLLQGQAV